MKNSFNTIKSILIHQRFLNVAMAVIIAVILMGVVNTQALASGPVFSVMNTSETLPDGVWFRNSPHTADTDRVTGHGVYSGDSVQLQCYTFGDAVGQYNNTLWYYVNNITRPAVPGSGASNVGYLNAHYINDGKAANQIDAGVPQCGAPQPTPTPQPQPTVRAIYYSPSAGEAAPAGGAIVKTVGVSNWSNPIILCDTSRAIGYITTATTLSGWSLGRLGPIYALARANSSQQHQINYIFMIDPGGYTQMATGCDAKNLQVSQFTFLPAGQIMANWLVANPSARLVIMAGDVTADPLNPVGGKAHAGIQNFYFNQIRAAGSSARSRTLVCNYSVPGTNVHDNNSLEYSHHVMYQKTNQFIQAAPLTSCPSISGLNQGASWHP